MKTKPLITTLATAALFLTACGSSDEPQNAEEAQQQYADELQSGEHEPIEEADDDFNPMDGMGIMDAGEFEAYDQYGAHIVFDLPTSTEHEAVADVEQWRQDVHADPVTYVVVEVDNRGGGEPVSMSQMSVFDEDGNQYEFYNIGGLVTDWQPDSSDGNEYIFPSGEVMSGEEWIPLQNRMVELQEDHNGSIDIAGAGEIVLAYEGDDLPDEFTRVSVHPSGFEGVEAYPIGY